MLPTLAILGQCLLIAMALSGSATASVTDAATNIRTVLSVPQVSHSSISPDGSAVAYTVTSADWQNNIYLTHLYVARPNEAPRQVAGVAAPQPFQPKWSPDGQTIAFLADTGQGSQIYLVPAMGGEPQVLTAWPGGLIEFVWAPDGRHFAFLATEMAGIDQSRRQADYGKFTVAGETKPMAHLWLLDVAQASKANGVGPQDTKAVKRLTGGKGHTFSVAPFAEHSYRPLFSFSPDGQYIAFGYANSLDILDVAQADIAVAKVATGEIRRLTKTRNWDVAPAFSPDGRTILFQRSSMPDFVADKILMTVDVKSGKAQPIKLTFDNTTIDKQPLLLDWTQRGIDFLVQNHARQTIYRIPSGGRTAKPLLAPTDVILEAAISADGNHIAVVATDGDSAPEAYRLSVDDKQAQRLTFTTQSLAATPAPQHELVSWQTQDGVNVQSILYSPAQLPKDTPTPLIVLLHGGPRDMEFARRLHNQQYPVDQWLAMGIRILVPNYRGSLGYGTTFRKLTWRNTGAAETLDIVSGVSHLAALGLIDPKRVAIAGHSWGGYLSAFASTSTNLFQAASVGSGITDNRINYVLAFGGIAKEGYLQSTPWENPELWNRTSPISYVAQSHTPTLIQHGDSDPVVPVVNAQEFYRALQDMNIPARLVLYHGQAHTVATPKEKLAWMMENYRWFAKYLLAHDPGLPWNQQ